MSSRAATIVVLAALAMGCKKKTPAIAELTKADGPVERQEGEGKWLGAEIGTEFFIGDAARTAEGGAQLRVAGNAQIAMTPRTVLRFAGTEGASRISVESGAIDLTGTGTYKLDVGDLNLSRNGTVRITSTGKGQSSLELTIGEGQVTQDGETRDLVIGKSVDLLDLKVSSNKPDAGVPDAGVPDAAVAEVDAGVIDTATQVAVDITGGRAETQAAGDKDWKKLPAGGGALTKGMKLRLGAGTTAKLTADNAALELAAGTKATVNDELGIAIDAGAAKASVAAGATGKVGLPGGRLELKGPGEARLDVGGVQAKVAIARGSGKLVGGAGATLDMNRGESAQLAKAGNIRVLEAIPASFDFRVPAGETLTIHDVRGVTAVQFQFLGKCPNGGVIEMDKDAGFRTVRLSSGKDAANMNVPRGGWAYRLRCTVGESEGAAVASGRIALILDDGHRPIPKKPATNDVYTDGRTTTVFYQSAIPNVAVHAEGSGGFVLHLATGGKEDTFQSPSPTLVVPGSKLHEGTYTYWIVKDGVKGDKVSTMKIEFDNKTPQVYVESPQNGQPFAENMEVKVSVLAGWTASIDGTPMPMDNRQRFVAKVGPPSAGNALAIRLAHNHLGIHYYLRRAK